MRRYQQKPSRPAVLLITRLLLVAHVASSFLLQNPFAVSGHSRKHGYFASNEMPSTEVALEGLLTPEEFERRSKLDSVIKALQVQLPLTLTKPLNAVSSQAVFTSNVKLTVLVDQDEIDLLKSREELIALSDVLVLGTSTAQQANMVVAFGSGSATSNGTKVECQILLDSSCQSLLVPWKAKVPGFPGTSSLQRNVENPGLDTFEGLSELVLNAEEGKVERHRLRNVSWNGQSVNGPAIGQGLRALQSTMDNLQNSPLFRGVMKSNNNNGGNGNIWADIRDTFLEQAATAASSRNNGAVLVGFQPKPLVLPVSSVESVTGFVKVSNDTKNVTIPLPGTDQWQEYSQAHEILTDFCERVVPLLSSSNMEDLSRHIAKNATLTSTQGSQLLQGRDAITKFFQGISLARRSTGGTWRMERAVVMDWQKLTVAIDYTATNTPWTISGQDFYVLVSSPTAVVGGPMIQEIRQTEISVTTPDGGVTLDGPWVMKNLASAVERSSSPSAVGSNVRGLFTDILFQQQQQLMPGSRADAVQKHKVSQMAAANTYFFMTELHNSIPSLWNTTEMVSNRNVLPPATQYLAESVELRGYLGETLLRGSTVYTRAFGSLIATIRQALGQKRLVWDSTKTVAPRVELTPKGKVRLTLVAAFRVPPPGGNAASPFLLPDVASVPLTLEIVSDYTLDTQSGLVTHHRLVETRVNGQLTPGDVVSRNLQRFLKWEQQDPPSKSAMNEDMLKSVSDAMSWLRSFSSNSGQG